MKHIKQGIHTMITTAWTCDRISEAYHLHTSEIIRMSDFVVRSHRPTKFTFAVILVIESILRRYSERYI